MKPGGIFDVPQDKINTIYLFDKTRSVFQAKTTVLTNLQNEIFG